MADFGVAEIIELPKQEPCREGKGVVEVKGLTKRFGPTAALRGVDLTVPEGGVLALIGENGAGKSTLIRILATVVLPDDGTVVVAGHDVRTSGLEVRRNIGLALGDDRSFFWRLNGRQNLAFFGRLQGLRGVHLSSGVERVLAAVNLSEVAERRVDRYSTGMRSRLGIARALLVRPRVLLLDEPTRSLDDVATMTVRGLVRRIADDLGTTVVLATHDLDEAATIADTVAVLAHGKVVARVRGPAGPDELRQCLRGSP